MTDVGNLWRDLTMGKASEAGIHRLRIPEIARPDTYIGISSPSGRPCLIVEPNTSCLPKDFKLRSSRGFDVEASPMTCGRHGQTRLVIRLADAQYRGVFEVLCQDIVNSMVPAEAEADAVAEFIRRLAKWRVFLRDHGSDALSVHEQVGLYGELWFLKTMIGSWCGVVRAVKAWRGSSRENHDFQLPRLAIEVKTTIAASPFSVRIANLRQLDPVGVDHLFLFHLVLDAHQGGQDTLPALVASIRSDLSVDLEARFLFDELLTEAGYLTSHEGNYADRGYSLRRSTFYRVDVGFPRLLEGDVPDGVAEAEYTIELQACQRFKTEDCAVESILGTD